MMTLDNCMTVGDSWASGVVAGSGCGWPLLLGIPDALRQAVSGSTAQQWAMDFDGRLTRAARTQADVVVISLLGNDAMAAMTDGAVTVRDVADGLKHLRCVIEEVRKPRTIVMLYADPFVGLQTRFAVAVQMLNVAICSQLPPGVETFDTRTVLRHEHFDARDIHPNADGHVAIARALGAMIGGAA